MPPPRRRPRVLVSNDDGIDAPGLRALVRALADDGNDAAQIFVCAPDGERSAQSHAITLNREMAAFPRAVEGATAAYAVQGTPADAVMLALNSALFDEDDDKGDDDATAAAAAAAALPAHYPGEANADAIGPLSTSAASAPGGRFDLVVSGINRGDNCGLHVIYSGTVGAAREGACKGVAALALSLDDHGARADDSYASAARAAAAVVRAVLSVLRDGEVGGDNGGEPARWRGGEGATAATGAATTSAAEAAWALRQGLVLNVNFPRAMSRSVEGDGGGLALCHQGTGCIYPAYREVEGRQNGGGGGNDSDNKQQRVFRAFAGGARHDDSDWCDTWAVRLGWTSLTPLSLRQDLRLPPALVPPAVGGGGLSAAAVPSSRDADAQEALAEAGLAAASEVVRRAAEALGVAAGGHLLPPLLRR
jgi:5'-nucleotidase